MVVYIFGIVIPIFYSLILRAFGGYIDFTKMITIYGYSQIIQVIMLLFCAYPNASFQNFCVIYGGLHGSVFMFLCFKNELDSKEQTLKMVSLITMGVCQITLVIIYKTYFFGDIYNVNNNYYIAN